jgi:hypothetical protein
LHFRSLLDCHGRRHTVAHLLQLRFEFFSLFRNGHLAAIPEWFFPKS